MSSITFHCVGKSKEGQIIFNVHDANNTILDTISTTTTTESPEKYQDFFVKTHPLIKTANPTWTPQKVTTEIGRRWSLQKMTIERHGEDVCVQHSKDKYIIDACKVPTLLIQYLEAYRAKYGDESFLKLVQGLAV